MPLTVIAGRCVPAEGTGTVAMCGAGTAYAGEAQLKTYTVMTTSQIIGTVTAKVGRWCLSVWVGVFDTRCVASVQIGITLTIFEKLNKHGIASR